MEKDDVIRTLKEDLKVKKELIAIKVMKEKPPDTPHYEGQATPGMCALVGEIIKGRDLCYVTKKNLGCFEALTGTGTCTNMPRDEYLEFMIEQNKSYPMHLDDVTLVSYYDRVDTFFKHPAIDGTGIIVGSLARVDVPDLVLLFLTPHQGDILTRARAYLGDYTRGFGGMGGCIFTIRYSYVTGDPSFSTSDTAWRMFVGLAEDELTYTFPYFKLSAIADRIKPTSDYVNGFKNMF